MSDLISRQELLNAISQKEYGHDYDGNKDILGLKYVDIIKRMPSVEPEKCGDCISRQAARNALLNKGQHSKRYKLGETWELNLMEIEETLGELPSVEPERKPGKWIDEGQYADSHSAHAYRCSKCGGHIIECRPDDFCKHCGADMREKPYGSDGDMHEWALYQVWKEVDKEESEDKA